jgi:hypothetical protein
MDSFRYYGTNNFMFYRDRQLGRLRRIWKYNMKIELRKMGFDVYGTGSESCPVMDFVVSTVESPGFHSLTELSPS